MLRSKSGIRRVRTVVEGSSSADTIARLDAEIRYLHQTVADLSEKLLEANIIIKNLTNREEHGGDCGANVTIPENVELQDSMIEEIVQVRFTVNSSPHRRVVAAEGSSSSRHLYHRVQEHFR